MRIEVLMVLVAVVFAVAAVVVSAGACPPQGGYVFNASGNFVCVPEIGNISVGYVVFSAWMSRNDTFSATLQYLLNSGTSSVEIRVYSPSGALLWNNTFTLNPDNPTQVINITLPSPQNYTIVYVTVDGYELGPYAVPYTGSSSVIDVSSLPTLTYVLLCIAAVAPVIAATLRYSLKAGGMAAMAVSLIYAPVMYALGLPTPIPELICAIGFIIGLLMIAAS